MGPVWKVQCGCRGGSEKRARSDLIMRVRAKKASAARDFPLPSVQHWRGAMGG
jgi:hypothetical protein